MTLGEMIDKRGSQYSGKAAMKFKDESWNYSDLAEQTNKMANGLKKLGVQKGDKVGLLMLNSPYFIISYFSIIKLGATVVPVNVMFKGGEVTYLLNDSKAVALVTSPAFMPMINEIRSQLKTVKDIIVQDRGQEQVISGTVSLGGMLDNETVEFLQDSSITEEDILNVYPREIEEVLYTNPKVAEAAVIGVPDELRGEMVKYCQERLANYKLPKSVEFLEAILKTSTGKILKRALRK